MGKICLNGEEYGNEVVANPQGSPTETLSTIQIGATVYELPSGGDGGGGDMNIKIYSMVGSARNVITENVSYEIL